MDLLCIPFWNSTLTWYTKNPDLTLCFEQTVLTWTPCIFLWLFLPLEIYYMKNSRKRYIRWNWLNRSKFVRIIILIIFTTSDAIMSILQLINSETLYYATLLAAIIKIISFLIELYVVRYNMKYGIRASGVIFLYSLLRVVCSIPQLRTQILNLEKVDYFFVSYCIYFVLICCLFFLNMFGDEAPTYTEYLESKNVCPEDASGFLSRLLFSFYDSLACKGFKRPLTKDDLWDMNPEDTFKEVMESFYKVWQKLKKKCCISSRKKMSVFPAMVRTFQAPFIFAAFLRLLQDLLVFAMPVLLRLLINFVTEEQPMWKGYFYAILIFVASNVQSLILAHYYKKVYLIGQRVRTVLLSIIYKKSLEMSPEAKKESNTGEAVNLMSVDVEKLVEVTAELHMLWSAPLQIFLSMYFLWDILGPSVLAGVAVLIILIPINAYIANNVKTLQIRQMKNKDLRVKMMNEILSGIKVIKFYAWEKSFQQNVLKVRDREMKDLKTTAYYNSTISFIWSNTPFLVSLVTFATYILLDENNVLDPVTTFVSLTLFNFLESPLSMLPSLFSTMIQAHVSLNRINKYINSANIDNINNVTHYPNYDIPLIIEDGCFSWDANPYLNNINLHIRANTLTAIVGPVGSGKSSLLSAFLGEMTKLSGLVNTHGKIAYVSQIAWIQNATLRDNILFGSEYHTSKYHGIIEACALTEDFSILPAGDLTEIGEKGINLSGGQKQRVSLARALYNDADVYFLDDPLSAVDSHIAKHIFLHVISKNGLLKNKTVMLATHNITFLSQCDNIIVLNNGLIKYFGDYEELVQDNSFSQYLQQHTNDYEVTERKSISKSSQLENIMSDVTAKIVKINKSQKLIVDEKVETGTVKLGVYKQYLKNIGYTMTLVIFALNVIYQCFGIGANLWLSTWSEDKNVIVNGKTDMDRQYLYLGVYGGLGVAQALTIFVSTIILFTRALNAAHVLHDSLLLRVLRAPITTFFDVTPIGRILNRFSKDIDTVDNVLPMILMQWTKFSFSAIAILFVISFTNPIFAAVVLPIAFLYYIIQRFYISASRQSKRLESITRSPLYSHFGETVAGAVIIRAFSAVDRFVKESSEKIDSFQNAYWVTLVANRWLMVRLEILANLIVFFTAIFAVTSMKNNPGLVGLIISYALQIIPILNSLVRLTSDFEANVVAVERIEEYRNIIQEAPWLLVNSVKKEWPENGTIKFENYSLKYRPELEDVLKDISCRIKSNSKIGIVGRTGAGKSSLTLSLFRIIEANQGRIFIDDVDISTIGLHDLRSSITIIPQEAVLFSGSLRMNVDPFDEFSDEEIWKALRHAHLKSYVKGLAAGIYHEVLENGENFSVGQRQLICLCRAILRKTKILVLDEATAAVDMETDNLIQKTIRQEFKDCTVLTIAHRINTIMDSDKVMVLDRGTIAEFDKPMKLLEDDKSIFYSMCSDAGLIHK